MKRGRIYLLVEFLMLFGVLPAAVWFLRVRMGVAVPLLPSLWLLTAGCLIALLRDKTFDRRSFFSLDGRGALRMVLVRFVVLTAVLATVVWLAQPGIFLSFPRRNPGFWAVVMAAYPVLSVYPQGIVYRAFIFHRYRTLVSRPAAMVLVSAGAFCFVHVVFDNLWALGLTLAGGLLFARTYQKTKSLLISGIEHALYGDAVFTLGLGTYLYHGTIRLMQHAAGG